MAEAKQAYLRLAGGRTDLSNREKTAIIAQLSPDFPVPVLLEAAAIPHSTYYYNKKRLNAPDKYADLKAEITEIFEAHDHKIGYRRVCEVLRDGGRTINHKLVHRLMRELGLTAQKRSADNPQP